MNFPEHFAPSRAAEQQRELSGIVATTRFGRLAYPYERAGSLFARLRFGLDEHNRVRLDGELRGDVAAICQRCLKPMMQEVRAPFGMLVLSGAPRGTEAAMDAEYLVAEQDSLDLMQLLEDELLLALPMVPRHSDGKCQTAVLTKSTPMKVNPFQVLAALKEQRSDSGENHDGRTVSAPAAEERN